MHSISLAGDSELSIETNILIWSSVPFTISVLFLRLSIVVVMY